MATYRLGRLAFAYYNKINTLFENANGVNDNATVRAWLDLAQSDQETVEAGNLMDVALNMGSEMADATTRESARGAGFASEVATLKGGSITFDMRWEPQTGGTTSFMYWLMQAWQFDFPIAMAFLDFPKNFNPGVGFTSELTGLAANFSVSIDKNEDLRDIQKASVTLSHVDYGWWYREVITGI